VHASNVASPHSRACLSIALAHPSIHPHRLARRRPDLGVDDEVGDVVLVGGLKGSWDYLYSCFKAAVADMPLAGRRKMFAENALRFYGIKV
jgi:hypothetical protein